MIPISIFPSSSFSASDPDVGEDFCRTLLSVLLQRKIGRVKVTSQCVLPGTGLGLRGVRLDVEVKELQELIGRRNYAGGEAAG